MKRVLSSLIFIQFSFFCYTQNRQLSLKEALVIGQIDKSEDRFTIEVNVTELLNESGIKAIPSLNILKSGADLKNLAMDSIQKLLKLKGISTYMLVSVRGYDKRFKPSSGKQSLLETLGSGNLFPIYREEISSVTFECLFFRDGVFMASELIKCGNISSKDSVIKRMRKKISKKIINWRGKT